MCEDGSSTPSVPLESPELGSTLQVQATRKRKNGDDILDIVKEMEENNYRRQEAR